MARAAKLNAIAGNVDYEPLKKAVDVLLFSKGSGGMGLEAIAMKNLLDAKYSTAHEELKDELGEMFRPFDDEISVKKCQSHACNTTTLYVCTTA